MAKDSDFLVTPMDYKSGPTNPKPAGVYDGDPAFPKRSDYGAGVTEKTFEDWKVTKSPAEGSPVVDAVINKDSSIT